MNIYRKYGQEPFSTIVVHGGPGAPGGMGYFARVLSAKRGVLEPFQTLSTIDGQVEELYSVIQEKCPCMKVKLIGHSWGAWLAFIFSAKYPDLVEKLILVGAAAFEEQYNTDLMQIRLSRLNKDERKEVQQLMENLKKPDAGSADSNGFNRLGELMARTEIFDSLTVDDAVVEFQPDIFQSVWNEAEKLRKNGGLINYAKNIRCPVVAIHGDYDPHPSEGISEPLSRELNDFRFILLPDCGHFPWKEKFAQANFFEILERELESAGD